MNKREQERQNAIESLKGDIKPGDTIYTSMRNVSRSGMSRTIKVFIVDDGEIRDISHLVATAIGTSYDTKHEGVKIGGVGMDVGFECVYNLSYSLFHDGFICIGDKCRSNDHSNGDRNYLPHKHSDPGYALNQRWM